MRKQILSLNKYGEGLPALEDFLYSGNGDNTLQRQAMKSALREAMNIELTARQREIILKNFFEKKSVTEIAKEMDLNKSTVSRHLKRAKEKLARVLSYGFFPAWANGEDRIS